MTGIITRPPTISVIVPVLNEAQRLREGLAFIGSQVGGVEVIVVDGGSRDESCAIATAADARLLHSPVRQRASQMNLGAREASGLILLFLHADTRLPAGWRETLLNTFARAPEIVGGAFRRRFDSGSRLLRMTCRLADWRGRRFGWFLGDQAMFVRRSVFEQLGGFASMQPFEDLEFSLRLTRAGRTKLLDARVTSSGRRFESRGALGQTCCDFALTLGFLISPRRFIDRQVSESQVLADCSVVAPVGESAMSRPSEEISIR
jgi:rSAM/selenodomain-associated transferase 2